MLVRKYVNENFITACVSVANRNKTKTSYYYVNFFDEKSREQIQELPNGTFVTVSARVHRHRENKETNEKTSVYFTGLMIMTTREFIRTQLIEKHVPTYGISLPQIARFSISGRVVYSYKIGEKAIKFMIRSNKGRNTDEQDFFELIYFINPTQETQDDILGKYPAGSPISVNGHVEQRVISADENHQRYSNELVISPNGFNESETVVKMKEVDEAMISYRDFKAPHLQDSVKKFIPHAKAEYLMEFDAEQD